MFSYVFVCPRFRFLLDVSTLRFLLKIIFPVGPFEDQSEFYLLALDARSGRISVGLFIPIIVKIYRGSVGLHFRNINS